MIVTQGLPMTRVLLLGGTTEASDLAKAFADQSIDAIFSYAGRTEAPLRQPLPQRIGGFGGVEGLVRYLRAEGITHLIDATHPFAAQMSRHAVEAAAITQTPLLAFERAPWQAAKGDLWQHVPNMAGAVAALPDDPARIFLAIGRQSLEDFLWLHLSIIQPLLFEHLLYEFEQILHLFRFHSKLSHMPKQVLSLDL